MPPRRHLEKLRFGRLVVGEVAGVGPSKHLRWTVVCDCGSPEKEVYGYDLTSGKVVSCGCVQRERSSAYNRSKGKGTVASDGRKHCAKCGEDYDVLNFNTHPSNKDRLHSWCKRCVRSSQLSSKYGWTIEEFEQQRIAQGGCCASCGDPLDSTNAVRGSHPVDHDHSTGRIRSILCHGCNSALGLLKEDPERIRRLALYCEATRLDSSLLVVSNRE